EAGVEGRRGAEQVHQEQKCDYINGGQTHKSMGVSFSYDGLSWVNPITVLTSPEAPKMGTQSGEGDCSLVRAPDEGYLYMYCFRPEVLLPEVPLVVAATT
ncbi:hypothetical protein ABI428_37975, partial [Pseudomonas aeruginosa]